MATSGYTEVIATWTSSSKVGDTLRFEWWQNSQNVAENYTDIGWAMKLIAGGAGYIASSASKSWSVTVDGQAFSGTNTVGIANNATKTLASGTKRVYHNNDGSKSFWVSFSQVFNINFNGQVGTVSGSGSWALNTIPRATTPSISPTTITMGDSIAISLPRAASGFTHTLYHDFQAGSWTQFATGVGTSASLAIPTNWATRVPDAVSATGKIRCLTYNGSTLIGEKIVNFTAKVPDTVVPTVNTVTVTEATEGIAAKFGAFVRNKSQLKIVSNGAGAQGSIVSTYKVEVLGISYTGADVTTYIITQAGAVDIKVTATDSRGRQGSKTVQVMFIEYFLPTITNFNAFRVGADGNEQNGSKALKCVFDFTVAPCGDKNDKSYKIEYKRDTATTWTTLTSGSVYASNSSYTKNNVLNLEYGYNIRLTVTDYFTSATYELTVGSEIVPLCVYPSGKGLGIGGYPDKEALQVRFDTEFYKTVKLMNVDGNGTDVDLWETLNDIKSQLFPIGYIYISIDATNPSRYFGGTWEQIKGKSLIAVDENDSDFELPELTGGTKDHTHQYGVWHGEYYAGISKIGTINYPDGSRNWGNANGQITIEVNNGNTLSYTQRNMAKFESQANTSQVKNLPPYLTVYMWKRVS